MFGERPAREPIIPTSSILPRLPLKEAEFFGWSDRNGFKSCANLADEDTADEERMSFA